MQDNGGKKKFYSLNHSTMATLETEESGCCGHYGDAEV